MRWRSLVAGMAVILWLVIYCLICMEVFVHTVSWNAWLVTPLYLISGIIWVFPCGYLFRWAAKDPRNSLSNEDAEKRFSE